MQSLRSRFVAGGFIPSRLLSTTKLVAFAGTLALLTACGGGSGPSFDGGGAGTVTQGSGSSGGSTGGNGSSGGTTSAPTYSIGNGSGTAYKDSVIDASKTTLQSGETSTLRVNVVDQSNNPPAVDLAVTFTSTCTSDGFASFGTVTQVTRGLFSVIYTNSGCDKAEDVVSATLTVNNKQATVKLKAVGPDVLAVSFVSATQTQLSLAGLGGNESSELIFKVSGPQGVPVNGKAVDFSINTKVGGATILSGRESGTSDQAGQVRTVINSGTVAGPINVKAVERSTGRQGISPDIVISSGVAASRYFSLSQSVFNPKGAFNTDGVQVTFTILASDAFGNNPIDGTRISFVSPESGNIANSCLLANGTCSVIWRSSSPRPADGRVGIIAYTNGAEDFKDTNGNSVYDAGDTSFTDLAEPYVDENENGAYDLGEFFFDANKNGVHDSGSTTWDGPCLSKVDASAVCTGASSVAIYANALITLPTNTAVLKSLGTFPTVGTTIAIQQGTTSTYSNMYISDSNANATSLGRNALPSGTSVTFSIDGSGVSLQGIASSTVPSTSAPTGPYGVTMVAAAAVGTLPTGVRLVLTITVPGEGSQEFAWPLNVTP